MEELKLGNGCCDGYDEVDGGEDDVNGGETDMALANPLLGP